MALVGLTGALVMPLAAPCAQTDASDTQTSLFLNALQPPAVSAAPAARPAVAPLASSAMTLSQLELALHATAPVKTGHGSGSSLTGGALGNSGPSVYGFCYEACATARAVGSCGTPANGHPAPSEACQPIQATQTLETLMGPSFGTGRSPFVDDNTGPGGAQPAGYTFLGQFVDHDVTRTSTNLEAVETLYAQSAGNSAVQSRLASAGVTPDLIRQALSDAATPGSALSANSAKLDLDSVYGVANYAALTSITAPWFEQVNGLYTGRFALRHVQAPVAGGGTPIDGFDYQRTAAGAAEVPDPRNSEHKIIAQIQGLFELAHNDCMNTLLGGRDADQQQIQLAFDTCHKKVIWTYETIVATDFLPRISAEATLDRVAPDALHAYVRGAEPTSILPRPDHITTYLYQCHPGASAEAIIRIPHEFAVAAFRLGHTLVRDEYLLHGQVVDANGNLLTGSPRPIFATPDQPSSTGLAGDNPLAGQDVIDWRYFFDVNGETAQASRPLDTLISDKLFSLPVSAIPPGTGADGKDTSTEQNLPRRNILRASQPTTTVTGAVGLATGEEAMAYARSRIPGIGDATAKVRAVMATRLTVGGFDPSEMSGQFPLWLYILAEAESTQDSKRLGELGSHIVDEFLLGSLKCDAGSVLNADRAALRGWGPTETIGRVRRYSMPDLVSYLQSHASVDGAAIHLVSR